MIRGEAGITLPVVGHDTLETKNGLAEPRTRKDSIPRLHGVWINLSVLKESMVGFGIILVSFLIALALVQDCSGIDFGQQLVKFVPMIGYVICR